MYRPRVNTPSLRRPRPDLGVAMADVEVKDGKLSIPKIVAEVMRDLLRERPPTPPTGSYTPYVESPALSGADVGLDGTENVATLTQEKEGLRLKCSVQLLPTGTPTPARIYPTGGRRLLARRHWPPLFGEGTGR